jgi:hypothetical protein
MSPEEAFDQTDEDDFDYSDLEPYEEVAEVEEKKTDDVYVKLSKQQRRLAEKQARMEAQLEREKLITDFYGKASDEAKEFADVLLAGVAEPEKVKKMLDLAEAKAAKVAGRATPEQEAEADEAEVEAAFAAPVASSPPEIRDVGKETADKTRQGDSKAAFWEFLAAPEKKVGPDVT